MTNKGHLTRSNSIDVLFCLKKKKMLAGETNISVSWIRLIILRYSNLDGNLYPIWYRLMVYSYRIQSYCASV